MHTSRVVRAAAAGGLTAALTVAAGGAPPLAAAAGGCTSYLLPSQPGSQGGEIIAISDTGIYAGDVTGPDGQSHAAYWTHAGTHWDADWSVHLLPSPLASDFVGDVTDGGLMVATGVDDAGNGVGYVYNLNTNTVTMLPGLGGGNDYDRRINASGVVAGDSVDTHGVDHAVTWSPPYKSAHVLPDFGASQSYGTQNGAHYKSGQIARGINDAGVVTGGSSVGAHDGDVSMFAREHIWRGTVAPTFEPVTWQANGSPRKLPTNLSQGIAWAIDNSGLVVGNALVDATGTPRPTAWVNGKPVDMEAPSDIGGGNAYNVNNGWATGGYFNSDFSLQYAFVWSQADGFRTLPIPNGYAETWAHGVNGSLHQVGGSADNFGVEDPVLWQC